MVTKANKTNQYMPVILIFLTALIIGKWFVNGTVGVNIDDSYIYLSYIRNFVQHGEIAYNPGEITFGATSLLWVLLISIVKIVTHAELQEIVKYTGLFFHGVSSVFVYLLAINLTQRMGVSLILSGLMLANPFLLKSSVSGLETSLNIAMILWVIYQLQKDNFKLSFKTGILIGFLFWSRPENLLFAAFAFCSIPVFEMIQSQEKPSVFIRLCSALLGFAIIAGPWSAYVYFHSGQFIPSTYKGLIYFFSPSFFQQGLMGRLTTVGHVLFDFIRKLIFGKFSPLLPGFFIFFVITPFLLIKSMIARKMNFVTFVVGYSWLFFCISLFMFPITMWRYLIPLIPLQYLIGGLVWLELRKYFKNKAFINATYLGLVCLSFVTLLSLQKNASGYRHDVQRMIDMENPRGTLAAAKWFKNSINPDDRIAAVGIGVVGYFSERYLLDLGGLIDPVVWPVLRSSDPKEAFDLLKKIGVNYILHEDIKVWGELPRVFPECFTVAQEIPDYDLKNPPMVILKFSPENLGNKALKEEAKKKLDDLPVSGTLMMLKTNRE